MLRKLILMLAVLVACASATVSAQTSRSVGAPMTLTITPFFLNRATASAALSTWRP